MPSIVGGGRAVRSLDFSLARPFARRFRSPAPRALMEDIQFVIEEIRYRHNEKTDREISRRMQIRLHLLIYYG